MMTSPLKTALSIFSNKPNHKNLLIRFTLTTIQNIQMILKDSLHYLVGCLREYDGSMVECKEFILRIVFLEASQVEYFTLQRTQEYSRKLLGSSGFIYDTLPPTVVKKFVTGKGNANKDLMYETFVSKRRLTCKRNYLPNQNRLETLSLTSWIRFILRSHDSFTKNLTMQE